MKNTGTVWRKGLLMLVLSLGLMTNQVRGEILLDRVFPWTEQQVGFALEGARYFEDALNRDQEAQGFERKPSETLNFFRLLWNDRIYYLAGIQYRSKEQNAARDAALAVNRQSRPIPGGGICAIFIYDDKLKQVAKHDVKLNEANGRTWCNGANALARVKGQDALLFSISYYLIDKPLAKRAQDIGDEWRYMTVLLKLREKDGQVFIDQEDSCLGNPNSYKEIAAARKALAACK